MHDEMPERDVNSEALQALDSLSQLTVETALGLAKRFCVTLAKAMMVAGADPEDAVKIIENAGAGEMDRLPIDPVLLLVSAIREAQGEVEALS